MEGARGRALRRRRPRLRLRPHAGHRPADHRHRPQPDVHRGDAAEPLAASAVDAGPSGGTTTNPLFPFSPHRFTTSGNRTTYTTSVYVTTVTPGHRRPLQADHRHGLVVSGAVRHRRQVGHAVELPLRRRGRRPTRSSSAPAKPTPGPCRVTGTLARDLPVGRHASPCPYVSGGIDSGFVKSAKGLARSGTSEIDLLLGLGIDSSASRRALAQADSDNDSGTAPPDTDQEGPVNAAAGSIGAAPALTLNLGVGFRPGPGHGPIVLVVLPRRSAGRRRRPAPLLLRTGHRPDRSLAQFRRRDRARQAPLLRDGARPPWPRSTATTTPATISVSRRGPR